MTGGELLRKGTKALREAGIEAPRLEAEVLLAHAWGRPRTELLIAPEREVPDAVIHSFWKSVELRAAGMPVAYLTGEREFMSLSFSVGPEVLIPRPETELLVERVLGFLKEWRREPVLAADVGTGSGAIAVSLACYEPRVHLFATDISGAALRLAASNAARHGVAERIEFVEGDLLEPVLEKRGGGTGAVVAANLPYIPRRELERLPVDVRREPRLALDGGEDGLDLYRRLIPQAAAFLQPGGLLACEIGEGQGRALAGLLDREYWTEVTVERDYRGEERLVTALRTGHPGSPCTGGKNLCRGQQ
ncbi:MAG TPA: peptide chain release factor N(5)-glutamine methyltransferase [Syntrophomonadaceae bacterium]|nr:peptide chain release factor N(5)-glutamine methyltransferase [Syntrophomonadaceae bacterium]